MSYVNIWRKQKSYILTWKSGVAYGVYTFIRFGATADVLHTQLGQTWSGSVKSRIKYSYCT